MKKAGRTADDGGRKPSSAKFVRHVVPQAVAADWGYITVFCRLLFSFS